MEQGLASAFKPAAQPPTGPQNGFDWLLDGNRRALNDILGMFGGPQLPPDAAAGVQRAGTPAGVNVQPQAQAPNQTSLLQSLMTLLNSNQQPGPPFAPPMPRGFGQR